MKKKILDSNILECNKLQVDIFLLKVGHCEKIGCKHFSISKGSYYKIKLNIFIVSFPPLEHKLS